VITGSERFFGFVRKVYLDKLAKAFAKPDEGHGVTL
jgi:hypothetical protein